MKERIFSLVKSLCLRMEYLLLTKESILRMESGSISVLPCSSISASMCLMKSS